MRASANVNDLHRAGGKTRRRGASHASWRREFSTGGSRFTRLPFEESAVFAKAAGSLQHLRFVLLERFSLAQPPGSTKNRPVFKELGGFLGFGAFLAVFSVKAGTVI
jgi:hypothetical protein